MSKMIEILTILIITITLSRDYFHPVIRPVP
jgi:hypothetical protein